MCDPVTAGVATFASGALGAVGQHSQQQAAYQDQLAATERSNRQAAREWEYTLKERDRDWSNQLTIWNAKKAEYAQTLDENYGAAQRAYESEQIRLNEAYASAAFAQQDQLAQMIGARGSNAARGVSGRSVGRADTAILGAFGRSNALIAQNLTSARNQMIRSNYDTSREHDAANMRAWRQVQFAPQPTTAPVAPMLNQAPRNPGSSGLWMGLGQAALSGFGTYASMKAPKAFTGNTPNPYSDFRGNIPSYSSGFQSISGSPLPKTNWSSSFNWTNNTFGIR